MFRKILWPFIFTSGATAVSGGSVFLLLPNSNSKDNNFVTIYKTNNKGNLVIGDSSFENKRDETNIVGISNIGWKHKEKQWFEDTNSNSFQLTGREIEKENQSENWKTILQQEGEESNKFNGSATFFLTGINCNDLNERFYKLKEYSQWKEFINSQAIELFGDKSIALWSCHEKMETIK